MVVTGGKEEMKGMATGRKVRKLRKFLVVLRVPEEWGWWGGALEEQFQKRSFLPGKYSSWLAFWAPLGLEAMTDCDLGLRWPSELRGIGMRK